MLPRLLIAVLCLLLAACTPLRVGGAGDAQPQAHHFTFRDGGQALYFVLDKNREAGRQPETFIFVVPGSECVSMAPYLPHYFDGLGGSGGSGPLRIFILHKRHVEIDSDSADCGADFIAADHPGQWLSDHREFIDAQLAMARTNGHRPRRVIALGISEGGELAPQLARSDARITHLAILANGGMNPADTFRLQARRHGFEHEAEQLEAFCASAPDQALAAGRSCLYWKQMFALDHLGNLLALDIPILVAMGEADQSLPPEAVRFLVEHFAARGKTNLTAFLVAGADHGFMRNGRSHLTQIWDVMNRWGL